MQIPKWTRAKFEVCKEDHNPIKQDEKKGVLRDYKWGDMLFNYGMFPQARGAPRTQAASAEGPSPIPESPKAEPPLLPSPLRHPALKPRSLLSPSRLVSSPSPPRPSMPAR